MPDPLRRTPCRVSSHGSGPVSGVVEPGAGADRRRPDDPLAVARHQRRDASAASPAPAVLSSTSSTDDTRSSRRMYCAVSTRTEQPAASARIRGTDAGAANRSGTKNPSAANTSRLPTTWPVAVADPAARM